MKIEDLDSKLIGTLLSAVIFILYHEIQQIAEGQRRTEELLRTILYRMEDRNDRP